MADPVKTSLQIGASKPLTKRIFYVTISLINTQGRHMTDKESEWLVSLYRSYRASGMSEAEAARLVDKQMRLAIVAKINAHPRRDTR